MKEAKHQVVTSSELKTHIGLKGVLGGFIVHIAMHLLSFKKVNKIYQKVYDDNTEVFLNNLFETRNNKVIFRQSELDNIPLNGPVIFVANHPLGAWDGLAMIKILSIIRPDIKFVVNYMLYKVKPIRPYLIGVNPFESHKHVFSSTSGIREMYNQIDNQKALFFFPAGEVSTKYGKLKRVEDRKWQDNIIKFIKTANCPVIPIHISGKNSLLFHFLGRIHPSLRTLQLPSELVRKKNSEIKIRVGGALPIVFFKKIDNLKDLGKTLKATTYCLNQKVEEASEFDISFEPVPVKNKAEINIIDDEIESVREKCQLFVNDNYSCFLATKDQIPNVFIEIARHREITFRAVGEGTGKSHDYDDYDNYYHHLFLWDNKDKCIAGAYRIGIGDKVYKRHGIKGFYLNSLFDFRKGFVEILKHSIELGRSFISQEYQRKTLPLFLLWKGINKVTTMYPDHKYLLGPVSISSMYSKNSTILMLEFLKRHYSDKKLAKLVAPKLEFKYRLNRHHRAILKFAGNDIKKIDKIIKSVDVNTFQIPVLVKKYLSLGGKILEFNVDPDFNHAIDGLVIINIDDISKEIKKSYE